MFVQHEITLPVACGIAQVRLQNLVRGSALVTASHQSYGDAFTGVLRVGPVPGMSRLVEARFRDLVRHGDQAVLTMRWEATGPGGALFPALDADLTLTPASQDATQLRLDGSYRPPLGAVGERLDRAVLHRVATATIQSFMAHVGEAIVDAQSAAAPEKPANTGLASKGPRSSG